MNFWFVLQGLLMCAANTWCAQTSCTHLPPWLPGVGEDPELQLQPCTSDCCVEVMGAGSATVLLLHQPCCSNTGTACWLPLRFVKPADR